jgi:hypothetical protein
MVCTPPPNITPVITLKEREREREIGRACNIIGWEKMCIQVFGGET